MDNPSLDESTLDCRKIIFSLIAISIITMLVYSNNYSASWHFDDEQNILDREAIHLNKIDWSEIKKPLFKGKKLWRPVSCLSLALNYYVNGTKVFGYHLINNLIHLTSAIFLFLFIYHTLNLPILNQRYRSEAYNIALLATIFWAINPIQTQAITYIVQRMASMAGMFYIMAMYFYMKCRTTHKINARLSFFLLSAISAIFAFGSKENALLLLPSLFLYELLLLRGMFSIESFRKNIKFLKCSLLFFLLIAFIYLYFIKGGNASSLINGYDHRTFTLAQRLLTEPRIIIFYISLILYPIPTRLSVNHDIDLSYSFFNPISTLFAIFLILFIILITIKISKKRPFIAFCIFFFFLNHLIESTFIPLELVFEHRNYIPSMLFFVPIAVFFVNAIRYFSEKRRMQIIIVMFITFLIIAYGHSTFFRNFIWKNEESLWLDSIEKYPELSRPYHNLARFYEKNNRRDEAIDTYIIATTKVRQSNIDEGVYTFYNLGVVYYKLKKEKEALLYFDKAENTNPYFAPTYMGRGAVYLEKGDLDKALSQFHKAFSYTQKVTYYHSNVGSLYLMRGEIDEAIYELELAIKEHPHNSKIFRYLGQAYRQKELYGKAFNMFNRALHLSPDDPLTMMHMIELFSTLGMKTKMENSIKRFFNSFHGNEKNLRSFLVKLLDEKSTGNGHKTLPNKELLISIIADECKNKSQSYIDIANDILTK